MGSFLHEQSNIHFNVISFQLKSLPVFKLPFTIKPSAKLVCQHQLKLDKRTQERSDPTSAQLKGALLSAKFVCQEKVSDQKSPYEPVEVVSHILILTECHVFLVHTETWNVKSFDISSHLLSSLDHVLLYGKEELLLGIDKSDGKIVDLKTSNALYQCKNTKIETYCSSVDRLFLSVSADTDTPLNLIQTLAYTETSKTLNKLSEFTCPQQIISLRLMTGKLVGTSSSSVYIWSLDGELRGELALPGSDRLVCRAARSHNSHTFLAISCASTLYSLVLTENLDDQRLIGELETQGNISQGDVFLCGFYCVFSQGNSLCVYNLITENLCAKFDMFDMKLLDVCSDYPLFLFLSSDSVLLCHLHIPES